MNAKLTCLVMGLLALPMALHAQTNPQTKGEGEGVTSTTSNVVEDVALDPDLETIQGKWKLIAMEIGGRQAPAEIVASMKYEFKGDILVVTPTQPGHSDHLVELDSTAKPIPTFDMTPMVNGKKGPTLKGIYVMSDKELKVCLGNVSRPDKFATNEETGYGQVMIVLKRE